MSNDCIFCKIVNGEIPADKIYEDDLCLAFKDLNPQAPIHLLLIPKKHIARLDDLNDEDKDIAGHLLCKASEIAKSQGLSENGFRTVINCGANAGQEVLHIHLHILGDRNFGDL